MSAEPSPQPTPEPTPPDKEAEKEKEFEATRERLLEEMKKKVLIKEIKESVDDTKVASTKSGDTGDKESRPKSGVPNVNPAIIMKYSSLVNGVIRERWNIPTTIPLDGSLEVTIDFKIDEEGKVSDVEIVEASANRTFDKFCIQAVYKAAPLPIPPPELREDAKYEGLEIKFRNIPK